VTLRRFARIAVIAVTALALVSLAAVLVGPSMGLFAGSRPANLGFEDGRFRADGSWKPNWVSSTAPASDVKHAVAPFAFTGDAAAAWARLEAAIGAMPRATVVTRSARYIHAEFASAAMGFVDDAEFALDAGAHVIHVRSGARLGVRDFGVNRTRVEDLRKIMSQGSPAR
jgi:uncharacterized protein (DUF1499 family)